MTTQTETKKKWLSNAEAAEELGVTPRTLEQWRYLRKGPKVHKSGRIVRYKPEDVAAWLEENAISY